MEREKSHTETFNKQLSKIYIKMFKKPNNITHRPSDFSKLIK